MNWFKKEVVEKVVELPQEEFTKKTDSPERNIEWKDIEKELPPLNQYVLVSGTFESSTDIQTDCAFLFSVLLTAKGLVYNWFCVGDIQIRYNVKFWSLPPIPKY